VALFFSTWRAATGRLLASLSANDDFSLTRTQRLCCHARAACHGGC
jgi:hypothetical protein